MFTQLLPPELELQQVLATRNERIRAGNLRQLARQARPAGPGLVQRALFAAGTALVGLGEWLRERNSVAWPAV